jgi:hypothetical protein
MSGLNEVPTEWNSEGLTAPSFEKLYTTLHLMLLLDGTCRVEGPASRRDRDTYGWSDIMLNFNGSE